MFQRVVVEVLLFQEVQEVTQVQALILIPRTVTAVIVPVAPTIVTIAAAVIEVVGPLNHVPLIVAKDSFTAPQPVPRAHFPRDQIYH